ncbi:MAG: hypothetical protein MUP74_00415, partial [Desulfobacterales bacterium]|nr:hypothetical protein [Desulfobacterales bacterium]
NATGATAALPIWADLIKSIPQYMSGEWFQAPPGVEHRTVCAETGYLAVEKACPQTVDEIFLAENVPTEACPQHRPAQPTRPPNPMDRFFEGVKNFFSKL